MANPSIVDEAVANEEVAVDAAAVEEVVFPDANQLITEDDQPVDNFASAKQQRLLVSSLYYTLTHYCDGRHAPGEAIL